MKKTVLNKKWLEVLIIVLLAIGLIIFLLMVVKVYH